MIPTSPSNAPSFSFYNDKRLFSFRDKKMVASVQLASILPFVICSLSFTSSPSLSLAPFVPNLWICTPQCFPPPPCFPPNLVYLYCFCLHCSIVSFVDPCPSDHHSVIGSTNNHCRFHGRGKPGSNTLDFGLTTSSFL
jgi:hypothetical protein